ncbi:unnamed protein product [Euphydryas editha]|uniref:Helicase ATP-binding domain-containing protein n=1 Tax=Euphydryas editha TaxID=104508 RepID=A0AAU9U9X9_EUPED|nr:unnamed protein product [Euphydryas editha]
MSSPVTVEDVIITDDGDSKSSNDDEASRNFGQSKLELIRNLFPPSTSEVNKEETIVISSDDDTDSPPKNSKKQSSADIPTNSSEEVFKRYIEGVEVIFPVKPYNSQMIVMSKVISALNKKQNCLVESPTGTGKTLALLCAALAWQKREEAGQQQQATTQDKDKQVHKPLVV